MNFMFTCYLVFTTSTVNYMLVSEIITGNSSSNINVRNSLTGVSAPIIAPETPNQLATDRATLAQEEEDAVQQQDNDDIGEHNKCIR